MLGPKSHISQLVREHTEQIDRLVVGYIRLTTLSCGFSPKSSPGTCCARESNNIVL